MEGIDKLQQYDCLTELHTLLTQYEAGEGVWLDINDHQSSIPPGKYRLARQCYVIATRTLFTRYMCTSHDCHVTSVYSTGTNLPQEVMDSYAHIWLSDSEEPTVGFLLRYLVRELVNVGRGKLPLK